MLHERLLHGAYDNEVACSVVIVSIVCNQLFVSALHDTATRPLRIGEQ